MGQVPFKQRYAWLPEQPVDHSDSEKTIEHLVLCSYKSISLARLTGGISLRLCLLSIVLQATSSKLHSKAALKQSFVLTVLDASNSSPTFRPFDISLRWGEGREHR